MKGLGLIFCVVCAVILHVGFILFGGVLFHAPKDNQGTTQEVELLTEEDLEDATKEDQPEEAPADIETASEEAPDAAEIIKNLEQAPVNDAPALDAASLSAIEAALSGQSGGGDFAQSMDFASGGVIGGKGKAGGMDESLEGAFSLAEIDQQPRATFQTSPMYPSQMRGKKVEGVVVVIFILDAAGKVTNPRAISSTNSAFEKPALDAVKKWKFEPAVKSGKRVACNMRVSIRFPVSK